MHEVPTWLWVVGLLVAGPKAYYLVQIGRRKKGRVKYKLRRIAVALACYFAGIFILVKMGYSQFEAIAFGFVLAIAAGFLFVRPPSRSRVIPKHIRRIVIERDLKGMPFDSNIHQIDHIVPYSKGGDHSLSNLRVISKTENLRRGARMPRLRELF